ncbi:MAG TPA: hypothetical protein VNU68_35405 [Verrucomicrobiae bacterium]|nr:hypothetical protein [Verrucomicrobiae bacterium]
MQITLNAITYRRVLDLDGNPVVLRPSGKQWRVASREQSAKILAGLLRPALGNVVPYRTVPDKHT